MILKGKIRAGITTLLVLICVQGLLSQSSPHLRNLRTELRKAPGFSHNVNNLVLTDRSFSKTSGIEHFYFRQSFQGLPIIGTESSIHVHPENGQIALHNRFANVSNFSDFGGRESPPLEILQSLGPKLGLDFKSEENTIIGTNRGNADYLIRRGRMSRDDIPFKRAYLLNESGSISKAWVVVINEPNSPDWWELVIDISNGNILKQDNYTVECFFDVSDDHDHCLDHSHGEVSASHLKSVRISILH